MEASSGLSKASTGYGRTGATDNHAETHMNLQGNLKVPGGQQQQLQQLPPHHHPRGPYGFSPPAYPPSRTNLPLKSVVTTSFEEREDSRMERRDGGFAHHDYRMRQHHAHERLPHHYNTSGGREEVFHGMEPPQAAIREHNGVAGREPSEHHLDRDHHYDARESSRLYTRDLPPIREGELEGRHPRHEMMRGTRGEARAPPSPGGDATFLHRSLSNASSMASYRSHASLKRSFWHHARPGDDFGASLPKEFLPPKRSKVTPPSPRTHEYIVTARPSHHAHEDVYHSERQGAPARSPGWFNRAMSWEASRDDYYQRDQPSKVYTGSWSSRSPPSSYRDERGGVHWTDAPVMPSPRSRYSPQAESSYETSSPGQSYARWHPEEEHGWGHPVILTRDEAPKQLGEARERGSFDVEMRRQGTFESASDGEPPMRFVSGPSINMTPRGMEALQGTSLSMRDVMPMAGPAPERQKDGTLLLALPDDRISLSETLCLVRENVEVFTATMEDVEAPAPGRKHAVTVGQVGLRCTHCRHTTRSSDRVKRAVCYPSSLKRIYRTVIDMKLDHFLHCKFVPQPLKEMLNALKASNTRSTGTTMQYFIRAASSLGLVDSPDGNGVRMVEGGEYFHLQPSVEKTELKPSTPRHSEEINVPVPMATPDTTMGEKEHEMAPGSDAEIQRKYSISSDGSGPSAPTGTEAEVSNESTGSGHQVVLALPEDKTSLSPLRCFLREQVCAFEATKEDIAVRTPTTFSVSEGQVGVACVHCLRLPSKLRLNRAVCFPFSIARIYQSVADIQRFHFEECKMMPADIKQRFIELQGSSSKGSKGLATRQYWVSSAKKLGLVDSERGIRFDRDPSVPGEKAVSLDILAQVASHANSVKRPLVLPEDKPYIAEFLYVVMDQLQACRFTEADRNKRRLKDVGCIGVECKHCTGQADSRKFFWSSVNAVESNFVSVHTHMMECKNIPAELKEKLTELKQLRKEQTLALKSGSQKAFFNRVWERLHGHEKEIEAAAAAEAAKKKELATEQDSREEEEEKESPAGEHEQVTRTDSVDEMSKESMEATPMNSPVMSPQKMEVSPVAAAPETPDSVDKIKSAMNIVSV